MTENWTCQTKTGYDSFHQAISAIRRTPKKRDIGKARIHPYRCEVCGKIHIGHWFEKGKK